MSRCMPPLFAAVLSLVALPIFIRNAVADDFRVFTVVHDVSDVSEGKRPSVRAMTLFHAGKVYDYVDAAGEVIIYEPTARQFRILNTNQGIVTTAALDEIKQLLKVAYEETERQAGTLSLNDPQAAKVSAMLHFQLDPRFDESYDEASGRLRLASDSIHYDVQMVTPGQPGLVEAYLEYADWVCRLNYLLHPGPVLPEPRLALNQQLRARDRLPKSVELRADGSSLHLKAEHEITFDLNSAERGWIHQWEARLKDPATRMVPLREYQRAVLTARAK